MERIKRIVQHRTFRFGMVGVANAGLNFAILNFSIFALHQSKIVASFIATTCAVVFSFILNRNFVFASHGRPVKQLVLFVVVTVSGVLLVQNVAYVLSIYLLRDHSQGLINLVHSASGIRLGRDFLDANVSNLVGALLAMFWNYNGYRLFVFKDGKYDVVTEVKVSETA